MRTTIFAIAGCLFAALPGAAQYGGRPGDTVMYVFTSKGTGNITTLPSGTVNTAAGLQIIDPTKVALEPFPAPFQGENRLVLHNEPGDVFEFIYETPDVEDPNQENIAPAKVLIGQGLLRITPTGEGNIDAPATFFTDFPNMINIAPHESLNSPYELIFWTNSQIFPIAVPAPITFVSPVPPPGVSGADYVISLGQFPGLVAWQSFPKLYPGLGWQAGTDLKPMEQDTSLSTNVRFIRIRPGRTTPAFKIDGNTHILVLQGSVQIAPAGGAAQTVSTLQYAFVPPAYAITLSNPAVYAGPGSSH